MTDNEIIKALEICSKYTDVRDCEKCPLKPNCDVNALETLSLDLINRQNAEVERLKKENTILSQNADTAFQDGLNEAQDLYAEQVKAEIKVEAYKEFAERLKEKLFEPVETWLTSDVVRERDIDNLLKEMVGDNNES